MCVISVWDASVQLLIRLHTKRTVLSCHLLVQITNIYIHCITNSSLSHSRQYWAIQSIAWLYKYIMYTYILQRKLHSTWVSCGKLIITVIIENTILSTTKYYIIISKICHKHPSLGNTYIANVWNLTLC